MRRGPSHEGALRTRQERASSSFCRRYGVIPGYGITLQDGFQDVETSTITAALELGAMPYAEGVIDNQLRYYVRDNGMVRPPARPQTPNPSPASETTAWSVHPMT